MAIVTNTFLKANVPYRVGPGANDLRTFSTDELAAYVDNTRAMMFDGGLSVPVLSEHAPPGSEEGGPVPNQFADAIKTAGWLKDVQFNPATGEAKAFYEITSKPYLNAIKEGSIRFTSPELRESYVDGLGRQWGETFAHFALTPKPRNPAQTQLSVADGGTPQFAMQFSMTDAVGIDPLQFAGFSPVDLTGKIGRRAKRPQPVGQATSSRRPEYNTNADEAEEKGPNATTSGVIRPVGGDGADRPMSDRASGRATFGADKKWRGSDGQESGQQSMYNASIRQKPNKQYTGMRRKKVGTMPSPGYGRNVQASDDAQQFDYAMQDAGMGFPGPVPQMNTQQGPYGSGNVGLEAALGQGPLTPPANPDVIQAPDEAKRQKSEAITQLMGQLGLQMPADTDWTALDDGVLNPLLASLKTLIDAESRYEQDNVQQTHDMQLKEQVPMANQMSEQFGMSREERKKFRPSPRKPPSPKIYYKSPPSEYYDPAKPDGEHAGKDPSVTTDNSGKHERIYKRYGYKTLPRPSGTRKKSKDIAMSEDTDRLNRRLAATKARLDGNSRHGLAQYVQNAPLPAGIKKHLLAKVGGVQFSADGESRPTFTVQEVVKILSAAVPAQFSEEELIEAADPRLKRDQQQTRRDLSRRLGDRAASDDGLQMSESDIDAYYDKKFRDPTWAKMSVNGRNGTH